jgi:ketosteroid isomerase-like protein
MNRSDVQAWLDRYVEAWRANEPEPIRALFTDDVVYRFRPYESHPAARGIDAVVDAWLGDTRDEPGTWQARYEPYAVDGDRAVAVGYSRYFATAEEPERTYHNAFLIRFAPDGRCAEFTEYYMLEETPT